MTQTLKTEMFTPVLAWLDAGAPHVVQGVPTKIHFDMSSFNEQSDDPEFCGSACCIAGALDIMNDLGVAKATRSHYVNCLVIGEMAGITAPQVQDLFFNDNYPGEIDPQDILPHEAAAAIRSMIETGEVVWKT